MPDQTRPASTVFRNGPVFCSDSARSWASAVAVEEGRIVAVGGDREIAPFLAHADEVVDLQGRLLVPGFIDAHVHPVMGGIERTRCDLTEGMSLEDYRATISVYVASTDQPWILGGGWSMSVFPGGCPTSDFLDAIESSRPVFLPNCDHHSAWVNTRALELAGITRDTLDPVDGRIERDASGNPTGALHEGAMDMVARLVPADTRADLEAGLREAQRYLHSLGVVGWQDAMVSTELDNPTPHHAYLAAEEQGWLTARVSGALWWDRNWPLDQVPAHVQELAQIRAGIAGSARYRADAVKVMLDGVAETFTAAMLEPYLDACGHPTKNIGISFLDGPTARVVTQALDSAGFQVHFHALGDRAVRDALDAIEAARAANGTSDRRHHLAHLQVIDPNDVARFRELGATANLQALWATHEPQMDELTIPFLGSNRAGRQYPFGELHRAGATLAMGSDWPVSTPDPLAAIHVAVNRIDRNSPSGTPPFGLDQALALSVAMSAYTAGSAWTIGREQDTGVIAAGRPADLVILDRDPFSAPVEEIADALVERTYIDGRLVYAANS